MKLSLSDELKPYWLSARYSLQSRQFAACFAGWLIVLKNGSINECITIWVKRWMEGWITQNRAFFPVVLQTMNNQLFTNQLRKPSLSWKRPTKLQDKWFVFFSQQCKCFPNVLGYFRWLHTVQQLYSITKSSLHRAEKSTSAAFKIGYISVD